MRRAPPASHHSPAPASGGSRPAICAPSCHRTPPAARSSLLVFHVAPRMCQTRRKHTVPAPARRGCDLIYASRVQIVPSGTVRGRVGEAGEEQQAPAGYTGVFQLVFRARRSSRSEDNPTVAIKAGQTLPTSTLLGIAPGPPWHRHPSGTSACFRMGKKGLGEEVSEAAASPRRQDSCPGKG